jgi:membrane fusion protein, adhesin transport system
VTSIAAPREQHRYTLAEDRPPRAWVMVVVAVCTFLFFALLWASWAEVDEISRADGRVIPSGKTQVIQSAEPGVIVDILVRSGEQVKKGQQLIRLDDTTTSSSAGEVQARVQALQAQVARLRAEFEGTTSYPCPDAIRTAAPGICSNEADLMAVRAAGLEQGKQVLLQRVEQRRRELAETVANEQRLRQSLALAQANLDLLQPLAARGLVAQTEFIAAQREVSDLSGQIQVTVESKARLEAALAEAELQVQQADLQFRQDALAELTLRLAELAAADEQLRGASDRVARTDVRSPVDGIVNSLDVNTIGAVVQAGSRLLDIVPVSDTLLVEARLKPSDVAFILPGQEALIKLTAYDFSIFGGLKGKVDNVSADSIIDPETRETYYLVLVRADTSALSYRDEELPVLPGMVTSVEILTGKKTVLQYLLKPINKARDEAFRER